MERILKEVSKYTTKKEIKIKCFENKRPEDVMKYGRHFVGTFEPLDINAVGKTPEDVKNRIVEYMAHMKTILDEYLELEEQAVQDLKETN